MCLIYHSEVANNFSVFFKFIYSEPYLNQPLPILSHISNMQLSINSVSITEIEKSFKNLKDILSTGLDQEPNFIIKDCYFRFTIALSNIFSLILNASTLPTIWKLRK